LESANELEEIDVVGLIANVPVAAWWVGAGTSLGIVWFVVKEGRDTRSATQEVLPSDGINRRYGV
jgi:hypothetical protein